MTFSRHSEIIINTETQVVCLAPVKQFNLDPALFRLLLQLASFPSKVLRSVDQTLPRTAFCFFRKYLASASVLLLFCSRVA